MGSCADRSGKRQRPTPASNTDSSPASLEPASFGKAQAAGQESRFHTLGSDALSA
ncbi:unnamed protein product, partial [Protopolystoma xenopodis]